MLSIFKQNTLLYLLLVGFISCLVNLPLLYYLNLTFTYIVFFFSLCYLILFYLFKSKKISYTNASSLALSILFIHSLSIPIYLDSQYLAIHWLILFPILSFTLKSNTEGLLLSILLFVTFIHIYLFSFIHPSYTSIQILIFTFFYITITIIFYFTNANIKNQEQMLIDLNNTLETKVEEAIQEIEKKEKLLQEQSRLAQMGEMISMIAHQWRQPLGAISSAIIGINIKIESNKFNLEIKKDRDAFLSHLEKKHNNVSEYVHILSSTIDDFRDFFKPDKTKQIINLTVPIEKALHIVKATMATYNIEILTEYKADISLAIYQNEMMQVILNILKNSEDNFIEKNILHPKIFISTYTLNDYYIISIEDNGGGIPESIIHKIFNPYFSTKEEQNGSGIGLYMSKIMIEEHHGGILTVENTFHPERKGVIFKISLPF